MEDPAVPIAPADDTPAPAPMDEGALPVAPDDPPVAQDAAIPSDPTYHISIWDVPPTFLCQVCKLQGLTKEAVVSHLATAHQLPAVPTLLAAQIESALLSQDPDSRMLLVPVREAPTVEGTP